MIPHLENYKDLFEKILYDYELFIKNRNPKYDLMNCFMGLNSIPEWLMNDPNVTSDIKHIGKQKNEVMKDRTKIPFDVNQIRTSLDHQLKFIRLYCNHTKHKTDWIPEIQMYEGGFPYTFPIKFYAFIAIGKDNYDVEHLVLNVINFWKTTLQL